MRVINLFGGPGSGKSTTAANLFSLMKQRKMRVELVTEFAKDLTYEGHLSGLGNQLFILGEQDRRLRRLVGQVDYAITDSPLPLGLAYCDSFYKAAWFGGAVLGAFHSYCNFNVRIRRVQPYEQYGRNEDEEEARKLDTSILSILAACSTTWLEVDGDEAAPMTILKWLKE